MPENKVRPSSKKEVKEQKMQVKKVEKRLSEVATPTNSRTKKEREAARIRTITIWITSKVPVEIHIADIEIYLLYERGDKRATLNWANVRRYNTLHDIQCFLQGGEKYLLPCIIHMD